MVTAVADSEESNGELARFALNIRSTRRHLFRQLSSDGPSGRALVAARSAALLVCGIRARLLCAILYSTVRFHSFSAGFSLRLPRLI